MSDEQPEPSLIELLANPKYGFADIDAWKAKHLGILHVHRMKPWSEWRPAPFGGVERYRRCDRCLVFTEIQQRRDAQEGT